MAKFKRAALFALCLLPISIVAGIFVGFYQLDTYSDELLAESVAQLGSTEILIVIGAVQTVGYAVLCGFFGCIIAEKIGLWRPIKFEKKPLCLTLIISLICGILLSLDHFTFGNVIDGIKEANEAALTVNGVIASVLYGGIIEEVMIRLFFMSLVAFVLWKLFCRERDREDIPTVILAVSNLIAATAFAAGHLPATVSIFGELTPLLLFRCFLLNGGFGIVFGWLYRKHGIVYAMMSHAVVHIVCETVLLIFA